MVTSGDSCQAPNSAPSSMRHLPHLQSESGHDAATTRTGRLKIAHKWREIQGANDWQGLLEPVMDNALREEIIRYGELTQVCYDSFDSDPQSKHYGRCKFSRAKLFQELDMADCGYQVTKYLYATSEFPFPGLMCFPDGSDKRPSNWMGYVAVCTSAEEVARLGRRDIVVCWRGTVTSTEWAADFRDALVAVAPKLRDDDTHKDDVGAAAAGALTHLHIKHHGHHSAELNLYRHALQTEVQEEKVDSDDGVKAERGFLSLYTSSTLAGGSHDLNRLSAREQLRQEIRRLLDLYKDEGVELSITVTGHSLGGALATVSAYDLALSRVNVYSMRPHHSVHTAPNTAAAAARTEVVAPLTSFTFGCPRVGNRSFKDHFDALGVKMLRVVNDNDIVPKVPGVLGNESIARLGGLEPMLDTMPWTYFHVGTEVLLDNNRSPFLKPTSNPHFLHNLEIYLHMVDGYTGPGKEAGFVPHGRDLALINKGTSLLVHDYGIPSSWWQDKNKGLRKNAKGLWAVPESPREEDVKEDGGRNIGRPRLLKKALTQNVVITL